MTSEPGRVGRYYDKRMDDAATEYYGRSGFFNFGYWLENTRDQNEASENLVDRLLAFIPDRKGNILDVACGKGATTRYLRGFYERTEVVAINLSGEQLEISQESLPDGQFLQMNAAHLAFEDDSFDNVICVEAVFHFKTREAFLREAHRVLKPGGSLVLSDIPFPLWAGKLLPNVFEENSVRDLDEYRNVYLRSGFQDVKVIDATEETWRSFRRHFSGWAWERLMAGEVRVVNFIRVMLRVLGGTLGLKQYLLVAARKA